MRKLNPSALSSLNLFLETGEMPTIKPEPKARPKKRIDAKTMEIIRYLQTTGGRMTIDQIEAMFGCSRIRRKLRTARDADGKRLIDSSGGMTRQVLVWARQV